MPKRATSFRHQPGNGAVLDKAYQAIRDELEVRQEFPPAVLAETAAAIAAAELPDRDETGVPFLTIDPPGAMDLDQAMHIERDGDGYRLRYAIADVPAFVVPGSALDAEALLRGATVYCPDTRVPLHPTQLSEDAASLLPDVVRPAFVWDIGLGPDGARDRAELYRARVRSIRRYTYTEAQQTIDGDGAAATLQLLAELGPLRIARESERGGASLPMPEQEVHVDADGHYSLRFRPVLAVEEWNAQVSLLTGIVAAQMMLDGGVGLLRTMPPAQDRDIDRFRRQARALGASWPTDLPYGDFLRTLDRTDPQHLAIIHAATALFRGAGYEAFDGAVPEQPVQAAIGAPYAHVTAPLRRLVDRYALVVCEALSQGREVPRWAREALPDLPAVAATTGRLAGTVERACTDATEAAVLRHRVGEVFDAVVVDGAGERGVDIQITDPAINAIAEGSAEPGTQVRVKLLAADVTTRSVRFSLVR
ncbi:RNB domain-containing ribonuclease [Georgenia sp. MJ173]|uniref:RNB domain-containing ribonuclease n=1 Tax=Georgenia sunbinii TaxID=3117728 RepID=UPI002F269D5D